jgi:hypothetical protein
MDFIQICLKPDKKIKKIYRPASTKKIISGCSGQRRLSTAAAQRTRVSRQALPYRMQKPLPLRFLHPKKP